MSHSSESGWVKDIQKNASGDVEFGWNMMYIEGLKMFYKKGNLYYFVIFYLIAINFVSNLTATEIDKMTEWIKLSLCFVVIQCFHIHVQLEIYMIINWFSEFKQDLIFVFAHDNMKNEYKSLLNRSRWIWMHVSKMN